MSILGLLLLLTVSALSAQKPFMGTVEYEFQVEGENAEMMQMFMPEKMVVLYGRESMLTYMVGGMMSEAMGKIVVNGANDDVFIIKEGEQAIYIMGEEDLEEAAEQQAEPVVTEIEGPQEKIMGYACKQYKVVSQNENGEMVQYIWATPDLEPPKIETPGAESLNNSLGAANQVPGFPLKVLTEVPGAEVTMTLLVTSLDGTMPPAETFERPAGFEVKEFDAEKMMEGGGN